jgi:hypothetical protein
MSIKNRNGKFTFEIGGKNKDMSKLSHVEHAWLVKDEMEYPVGKSLPLWLFGFLY